MFDTPFFQDNIWSNLLKFNLTTLTSRGWLPWMLIVALVLASAVWCLRKQLRTSPAYFNLFENNTYKFHKHSKSDWGALAALSGALILTAWYMFTTENSFFENFDLMALGTMRSLKTGLIPNFDFARITPLAFWNLSTLYAITHNMYLIKAFVFIQLLLAVAAAYYFFDNIPTARRLSFLAVFLLTPTMLLTSKVVFPDREIIILLMLSLICIRRFSRSSSLKWLGGFLFFMNFAIYTKETCILFYFGPLAASLLYNIWNEKITPRSFLHPMDSIRQMPLEFLMGLSMFLYAIVYFLLQMPNAQNIYLQTNFHPWQELLFYYKFELAVLLVALGIAVERLRRNYNTAANPMFRSGLVVGGFCVAVTIIFILQTAPNSPHLAGKTYYLLLPLLFSLAYIFRHVRSRLTLLVLSAALLLYSAVEDYKARQGEIGVYYREVAEFMAQQLPKGKEKKDISFLFVIDKPQAEDDIDKWVIEAWSSVYYYYLEDYHIVFKSDKHIPRTLQDLLKLRIFRPIIYFPIIPQEKPAPGDWVIINKNNQLPKTLEIKKQLPDKPLFENKLFEVYHA